MGSHGSYASDVKQIHTARRVVPNTSRHNIYIIYLQLLRNKYNLISKFNFK